ncbi:bifunctional 2-polyprenyl-6-hydroxyphenol methylase/3-demethylubiquinol 3-O-methyltransferase UbiG [Faunimonas sp. B44]|uniref:bifunctional 2-polyprenyl-6-hydroxyphenol methylase/3-demethylubiquinol 3-O-methyltransferase UbiG n=1 Tax=Faunimonas sp. B44 TaxID=3461493 RepID=UPI004045077E
MASTADRRTDNTDPQEVAKFARMADDWWNPAGKLRPLHQLNPVRLGYVRDMVCDHFGRDANARPFEGLRFVDIGCGGGLVSEPVSRLGAETVGIDPAPENVAVARLHAERSGCTIDYRATTAEALVDRGEGFDVVLALEVVEHVPDLGAFIGTCAALTRPGGMVILATINRTMKAYALAIVGAEYVLRWLPRGTHEYGKLVRPDELGAHLTRAGLAVGNVTGIVYDPLRDRWKQSSDTDVNYMMSATRPPAD